MSPARAATASTAPRRDDARSGRAPRRAAEATAPRLEVVEHVRWWRRAPWGVVTAVAVFVSCLFGALWTHVSLIDGQERLDRLQSSVADQRLHREELRRIESQLQGPDEVRRIAIEDYGMVDAAPAEAVPADRPVIRPQALPDATVSEG